MTQAAADPLPEITTEDIERTRLYLNNTTGCVGTAACIAGVDTRKVDRLRRILKAEADAIARKLGLP